MKAPLSSFLNASRWVAAWLVLTGHVRHLVLIDYRSVTHPGLATRLLYVLTGLGHEAVVVFFVISGLLVGGTTLDRWRTTGPEPAAYLVARVSRLYTVLLPALVVGLCWDRWGLHAFDAAGLYSAPEAYRTGSLQPVTPGAVGLSTFLGNLLMLQGIATGTLGSNSPLWSLAYEWWYYCLYAALLGCLYGARRLRVGAALAAAVLIFWLPGKLLAWGLIWALGVGAHLWIRSGRWLPSPGIGLLALAAGLGASRAAQGVALPFPDGALWAEFARDLLLGATYVVALAGFSRAPEPLPFAATHARLADFSYTTYLCHFPLLLFAMAVLNDRFAVPIASQPGPAGYAVTGGLVCLVVLYCYGCSLLTERHTAAVRARLGLWLAPRSLRRQSRAPSGSGR